MSASSILSNYIKELSESQDPKRTILKYVKGIEKEKIYGNRVIVATYARPAKTSGGIILTDNARNEDIYQGVCGLVVAKSDQSFVYTQGGYKFEQDPPKLHEWVVFRFADSYAISYSKASCRVVDADSIICVTKSPEKWY